MTIDAIHAISQTLSPVLPIGQASSTEIGLSTQQSFAALLNSHSSSNSPSGLLEAQNALSTLAMGAELTAKVAGSLGQTINKLVNLS